MNPVFWLLVIIVAVILWFLISFIFIPLGSVLVKKWDKTVEILNKDTELTDEGGSENE